MALSAWERVSTATIDKHLPKLIEPIFRKRILMALLRKMGRIKYGCGGPNVDWRVQFKLPTPSPIAGDMQPRSPQRRALHKTAVLPWRGYEVSEAISKFERLQQQGSDVKLFDIVANATENLSRGMVNYFHKEFYADGNAAGSTDRIHGFESWLAGTNASAKAATAGDVYAGLNTTLGTYGGTWSSGTYPEGDCNNTPEYEAWSPLLWDYADSNWSADGTTWQDTCQEVVRHAIFHNEKRDYPVDVIILDGSMFIQFAEALSEKERINVSRGEGGSLAIKMGFKAINFDGTDVLTESGVPANVGYGLSVSGLQLMSMQKQLFVSEKDDDWSTKTKRLSLDFYGNFKCETPRATFKLLSV